jgi:transposase
MQLKTILNQCSKFKCFVYDKVRFVLRNGEKCLDVVPRRNSQAICSCCGKSAPLYDRLTRRRFEFVPLWGYRVFLVYLMRRVDCAACGVKVEQVPWGSGKHELTDAYQQFLAHWAKKLSWKEVAVSFRTSWGKVFRAVESIVEWGLKHRDLSDITAIGVDEIAWRKGHKYLTMVYQIDKKNIRLLWIGKDRTIKTLLHFFHFLGEERSQKLKYVCSDMWRPYIKVIKKKAGQALHILDRFHIVAKLNKAIDEVRAGEHRQMQKDGYEPVLKSSRWCLLKHWENLTDKQEIKLRELLQYNLKSVRAYLLKEDFNGFWEYVSPVWAEKYLDKWCSRVMRSRIEPMKKVVKTIRNHKPLILNWFKAKKRFSSGIVEGLNNKAKVTTRNSYGFRTYRGAEIALYHALAALPTPPTTHRFW